MTPTPAQLQTLHDLRERLKRLQDEVHELRYPGNSNAEFGNSIRFGGSAIVHGLEDTLEAVCSLLGSACWQVSACCDEALPYDFSNSWTRARSLPPERDVPDAEGDASHTVPALATR